MALQYATTEAPSETRLGNLIRKFGSLGTYVHDLMEDREGNTSVDLVGRSIQNPMAAATTYAEGKRRLAKIAELEAKAQGEHPAAQKALLPYLRDIKKRIEYAVKRAYAYINKIPGNREALIHDLAGLNMVLS